MQGIGALEIRVHQFHNMQKFTKFYQAGTSNVWQGTSCTEQKTPFLSQSPYGVAKLYAH